MSASASAEARKALKDAAGYLLALAGSIPADGWTKPALGEWNVRDLLGHALRAFTTIETYLQTPASGEAQLGSSADYFASALDRADPGQVAERGREAGAALGDDPVASARDIVQRVLSLVDATPDDVLLPTPFGTIRLADYIPSRVFELTVHSLDLASALGEPLQAPEPALRLTMDLTAELLVRRGRAAEVILAATGRGPLPPGFTLF
ncbi:MAG TPA: maleylpyruvate isomerase family mycothiol-dependent enzyme [Chloroflexota bacterium]|nr:maleylpyruvate isomerase family mycothiol-dependent enzyme [Chloroflexota bacterium]